MRSFIVLLLSFFISTAFAVTCEPLKVKMHDKNIVLSFTGDKNSGEVYFFHNLGQQGIWLDHPTNKSMSAGWSSYLRAGNWSAFLLNRKNFEISCSTIQPGHVDSLDCSKVVSACTASKAVFKKPVKGTYWLGEDKSWDELVKVVTKRGIALP